MPSSTTRLDWLSFTASVPVEQSKTLGLWFPGDMADYVRDRWGEAFDMGEVVPERGRYPYRASTSGNGIKLYWTQGSLDFLVEVTGDGCARLESAGQMSAIVRENIDNLTRVDIATDIVTNTNPIDFAEQRTNKRHRSHETAVTPTGTTYYVGSRRSDRFARVYRYAEPHPRSDRLRVECVFRSHQAVALARTWLEHGNDETAARVGNQYGWAHKDWTLRTSEKIPAWRPDRKTHNTMHWYKSQVVPALRKLVRAGLLSQEQLIEDIQNGS